MKKYMENGDIISTIYLAQKKESMIKKINIRLKKKNVVGGLFAIIATMILMAPYHADNTLWGANFHSIWIGTIYTLSAFTALLSILLFDFSKKNYGMLFAIASVIIYILFGIFHSYNSEYNGVFLAVQCISFLLLPNDIKKYSFKFFKKIWVVICVIGIVCFLFYAFKIPVPYQEVPYYFGDSLKYINYGVSFLYQDSEMFRLCGLCNEPGYLGTICALILCADCIKIRKKTNIVILIAGLMTFSVAFFVILIVYLIMKAMVAIHNNKNTKKKILYYICLVFLVIFYFIVLPNIKTGDTAIDKTIQRLTITSEGLVGDNRTTSDFDALFESSLSTNPLFGMGKGYVRASEVGDNSSYKIYIIEYGIMGSALIWGTLLVAALYKNTKNKNVILFVVVFFASIYQRPNIIALPYLLILIGGIEYIKTKQIYSSDYLEVKDENKK